MHSSITLIIGLSVGVLAGCSSPQFEDRITAEARTAPYPTLVPLEGLLAQAETVEVDADTAQILHRRAAALRARAALLRRENGQ